MSKPLLSIAIALFSLLAASPGSKLLAQCGIHPQAQEGPLTLQYTGDESGTVMNLAYSQEFHYYYANHGGNTSASLVTFDTTGTEVAQVASGMDFRGLWWNPSNEQIEGNGYDYYGILVKDYNQSTGVVDLSGGSFVLPSDQPNEASIGSYDTLNNEIVYVHNSVIYRYNRNNNQQVDSIPITGLPATTGDLNSFAIVYGPCEGRNVGVYEYNARIIHFVDGQTGEYTSSSQLPQDAPTPEYYGVDFANGYAWIYDQASNSWKSYDVINTDCVGEQYTQNASICEGDSIMLGGEYRFTAGSYIDGYVNQTGCDSTILMELNINENFNTGAGVNICQGDSVLINGQYIAQEGNYTDSLTTVHGCDSVVTKIVSIFPTYQSNAETSICAGDSILLGGQYRTAAGVYADTLAAETGCDSIVDVNLSLRPAYSFNTTVTICAGDSTVIGGEYESEAGSYVDEFTTTQGCDSIYTTELVVTGDVTNTVQEEICGGDSILIGAEYHSEPGDYTATFQTGAGCDSTVTVQLTVNDINSTIALEDLTLFVTDPQDGPSYQWLDCDDGFSQIDGATAPEFDEMFGYFAVAITYAGCTDTSTCESLVDVGFEELGRNDFTMYPNPAGNMLYVDKQVQGRVQMEVYDITGKMVVEYDFSQPHKAIDLSRLNTGAYMVRFTYQNGVVTNRLVVR